MSTTTDRYIVGFDLALPGCQTSFYKGFDGVLRTAPWLDRILDQQSAVSDLEEIARRCMPSDQGLSKVDVHNDEYGRESNGRAEPARG